MSTVTYKFLSAIDSASCKKAAICTDSEKTANGSGIIIASIVEEWVEDFGEGELRYCYKVYFPDSLLASGQVITRCSSKLVLVDCLDEKLIDNLSTPPPTVITAEEICAAVAETCPQSGNLSFVIQGNEGSESVADGNTVLFTGGSGVSTEVLDPQTVRITATPSLVERTGTTDAGTNLITHTSADGTPFQFCEGVDTLDLGTGCNTVSSDNAIRSFAFSGKTLAIRSAPEHYAFVDGNAQTATVDIDITGPNGGNIYEPSESRTDTITITNPLNCPDRPMRFCYAVEHVAQVTLREFGQWRLVGTVNLNGAGYDETFDDASYGPYQQTPGQPLSMSFPMVGTSGGGGSIGGGQSLTISAGVGIYTDVAGAGESTLISTAVRVHVWAVHTHQ